MMKTMSTYLLSLFFTFLFLFASAYGRSLQKTNRTGHDKVLDLQRSFFPYDINATKGVSLASDSSYNGLTNYNDVLGMVLITNSYPWLMEYNQDPCVTPRWTWIVCNSDARPRVIALRLSARLLFAPIPDFSIMNALQRIDLSLNLIDGPIPSFLGTFPDLHELNLEYNGFSGQVPNSLACNKNLNLRLTGNGNLYTSGSCPTSNNSPSPPSNTRNSGGNAGSSSENKSNAGAIAGGTIGALAFIGICAGIFAIYHHRARTAAAIAEAASTGPDIAKDNVAIEQTPVDTRPNNTNAI
ncbi:hypothetical protein ABFS83_04G160100 [Erythranthe nasuta]